MRFALRSSAIYEDSEESSFAGVFESWVGITDLEQLRHRLVQCWGASWAPQAIRYLRRMGIEPIGDGMAIMITRALQEMGRSISEVSVREVFESASLDRIIDQLAEYQPGCADTAEGGP